MPFAFGMPIEDTGPLRPVTKPTRISACASCGTARSNAVEASRLLIKFMAPVFREDVLFRLASAMDWIQVDATSAMTRSGLPEPFWIFSGEATMTAPVGGS